MTRLTAFLRRLGRDRRGAAAIEFAFMSTFLFAVLLVALDFGAYVQQRLKLGQAVEQGAMIAFGQRANQPTVTTSTIASYVAAMGGGSTVSTSFQCNGQTACSSANTAQSMCIGAPAAKNGWPSFTAANPTTKLCASGASPGYYLVIRATRTFKAVVTPDKYLGGKLMQQQTVVRLS